MDTVERVMTLTWEVTEQSLAAGASSGGRGATTVIFAPVQGFFAVRTIAQLNIQVRSLERFKPKKVQYHTRLRSMEQWIQSFS